MKTKCQNCFGEFATKKSWHLICPRCWRSTHTRGKSKAEIREKNKKQTELIKK